MEVDAEDDAGGNEDVLDELDDRVEILDADDDGREEDLDEAELEDGLDRPILDDDFDRLMSEDFDEVELKVEDLDEIGVEDFNDAEVEAFEEVEESDDGIGVGTGCAKFGMGATGVDADPKWDVEGVPEADVDEYGLEVEILAGELPSNADANVTLVWAGSGGGALAASFEDLDFDLEKKKEPDRFDWEEFLEEEEEAEAPTDLAFSRYRLYRSSITRISSSFLDNWSRSSATVSAFDDNCVSNSSMWDDFFLSSFSTEDVFCMASVSCRRICELACPALPSDCRCDSCKSSIWASSSNNLWLAILHQIHETGKFTTVDEVAKFFANTFEK